MSFMFDGEGWDANKINCYSNTYYDSIDNNSHSKAEGIVGLWKKRMVCWEEFIIKASCFYNV